MPFYLNLQESDGVIAKRAMLQIATSINNAIRGALPIIGTKVKGLVSGAIQSSPEYNSLLGGTLQGELGVPQSATRLQAILDIWLNSLRVSRIPVKLTGSQLSGGFSISMIRQNWSDVLSTPEASYTTSKGQVINWLEWLLIAGDSTIVTQYNFTPKITRGAQSRTGLGIMRSNPKGKWHVPREFSGTAQNNFVTRSLEKVIPLIIKVMQVEFEKRIV